MKFCTQEEFQKFIQYIVDPSFKLAFNILFYTGIRCGELLALTIKDYLKGTKELKINKTLSVIRKEKVITDPKTKKSNRTISLPEKLCEEIDNYIATMFEPSDTDRLFPLLNKYSLRRKIQTFSEKAEIETIRIHNLRHSHASLLIELNFPPLAISERLGHEDIMTTLKTYSHLYPNKGTEIANKLNELL